MNVLLDTCTVIWSASEPDCLSEPARNVLRARDTAVYVSPISCAELCCLQDRKRIAIQGHWKTWFNRCLDDNQWRVLDITLAVLMEAYSLPETFHRDPADRILVGTARLHDLRVVTADRRILDYPHVKTLW
ncbi:MAG: type II toxin-antitoxin system VapC family toxin [Lentisphaerae bacterium]|nr:type II toxin-antitoxin system VapC family toxin [Lentisphaerota bacterium]